MMKIFPIDEYCNDHFQKLKTSMVSQFNVRCQWYLEFKFITCLDQDTLLLDFTYLYCL